MTQNASFIRKVVYISIMAVLLIPLSYISQPSTLKDPGGVLAQQRTRYRLSESELGEVDPTSETMKLATLGMRGVACTILWQQANKHKMKENWDAFAAVLRQISKLQPHFTSVWIFQSWNMSYNVSVEFDDYRHRYEWVKKGVDYLIEGTRYNQRDVRLRRYLGFVFGHKFGRSDEVRQYRRMFHEDDDFHKSLPIDYNSPTVRVRDYEGRIDNWLVSREFFLQGQRIVDQFDVQRLGHSPVVFHSEPAMARMNYAEAIEEEGYFGERANLAWRMAGEEWHEFGARRLPTSWENIQIQLNELENTRRQAKEASAQLDDLLEGTREKIHAEKLKTLTDAQREAYQMPADERTADQDALYRAARKKMHISPKEIADRAPDALRDEAERLSARIFDLQERARIIENYRQIVNFEYWKTRAKAEQTQTMVDARRYVYEAGNLFNDAVFDEYTNPATGEVKPGAREMYEMAFENWAKIFEQYPLMLDNPETEDLLDHIENYRRVLDQLDLQMPADFRLQRVIELHDSSGQFAAAVAAAAAPAPETDGSGEDDPRTATPAPPQPPDEASAAPADSNASDPRSARPRPPMPTE